MRRGILVDYKSTDGLMRHLRSSGIAISGSRQKRLLINTGYYHGYKGYRFFKDSNHRLPFSTYDEIYATIQYDTKLKALLYAKIMFIETALKNIAIDAILKKIKSNNIQDMFDEIVLSYKNATPGSNEAAKKKIQKNKLNLQSRIQNGISQAYQNENPKIAHFYNKGNYKSVPIWAVFEILSMGDFGFLLSCLDIDTRYEISKAIGINLASDTNRELVYKYVYALKDLRNAIAHNDVIYDTRFRKMDPSTPMIQCLKNEMALPYVNFKTIGDYMILVCYYLKLLQMSKTEIRSFIREFEKMTDEYKNLMRPQITNITIHPDLAAKMNSIKKYI